MSKKKTFALFSVVVFAMIAFTPMLFACNDDATLESVAAVDGADAQAWRTYIRAAIAAHSTRRRSVPARINAGPMCGSPLSFVLRRVIILAIRIYTANR